MRQLILDIRPDAPPRFDNFLAGPNAEVVDTLSQWQQAAAPYSGEHVLYLWGETGVGKTHLLRAWAVSTQTTFHDRGALPESDRPMLAIDQVEQLPPDQQIALFVLLNNAREHGGRLIVAGNQPPSQLAVRPDLATRLAQGLVFRLLPLTDADKAQALTLRAESLGMTLHEDVLRHLLTHCRRDLPRLLATLDALDTLSLSRKRAPSVTLLREMLQAPQGN